MSAVQLRLKEFSLRLRLREFLPDLFWCAAYIMGLLKVLAFMGITTSWNNEWQFFISRFFSVPTLVPAAFTLMYFAIALFFKGRARLWVTLGLNAFLTLFLIFDLMYFRGYSNFLSIYLFNQASNLDNLGDTVVSMLRPQDALFLVDLLLGLFFILKFKSLGKKIARQIPLVALFSVLTIGYMYYAHYQYDIVEGGQNRIVFRICWTPIDTMRNLSPIGYHIYDSYEYFKENRSIQLTEDEHKAISVWYAENQETRNADEFKGIFAGKNLILLQVESLENFVINQSYQNQEITPNLNRLLQNSIYFSNFYEQVWNGTTSDAELMSNTSVYPVRRGSTFFRFPQNEYNSLPQLMETKGYTTQAIHPDKGAYWNWRQALTAIGFDNTIDESAFVLDEKVGLGLSDGSFLRQVVPILKETKQPFYNFMITLTSHGPFDIPQEYRDLEMPESLDQTKLGGYFQSLHYTDKQIGAFLENLDKEGLLDNTVVVIYGDHGGIHKYYNDELATIQPQEDWWMNYDKKVPLIVYSKGIEPKVVETTGGQVDILPTVSYLMGINEAEYSHTSLGRNLLTTNKDYVVLADGTFVGKSSDMQEHVSKGIDISDLLVQGNYFKSHYSYKP
jgi:phosphoglycerol transferase MdoB-like AlkP superfamily enzyme